MVCLSWFQFALVAVGSALALLVTGTLVCLVISVISWRRYVRDA